MLILQTSTAIALIASGISGEFPAEFQHHWEYEPTLCDPADGESIGDMYVESTTFIDMEREANVLRIEPVSATSVRVTLQFYDPVSDSEGPVQTETWNLQDGGMQLHIMPQDSAGRPMPPFHRYRCMSPAATDHQN